MEEYGPDETWPRHPKAWWNETLDVARARRWTFTSHSAHAFGKISCETQACNIPIYSTGKAGESVARGTRKKIEQCVHSRSNQSLLVRVETKLNHATKIISAAGTMIDRDNAARALDLLAEADDTFVDATWDEFGKLVDEVDRYNAAIEIKLAAIALSPGTSILATVDTAKDQVDDARLELVEAPPQATEVKRLMTQAKQLLEEIETLRRLI